MIPGFTSWFIQWEAKDEEACIDNVGSGVSFSDCRTRPRTVLLWWRLLLSSYRYGYPGQYYRYYDGGYYRGRGYGYGGGIIGYNSWGQREVWYQVSRSGRCPRGYTVQDGVCKLYRGY